MIRGLISAALAFEALNGDINTIGKAVVFIVIYYAIYRCLSAMLTAR